VASGHSQEDLAIDLEQDEAGCPRGRRADRVAVIRFVPIAMEMQKGRGESCV
jgi:hypothetical protein